jgi:hypothetical protein
VLYRPDRKEVGTFGEKLRLRSDLIKAGDAISNDRQTLKFSSASVKRRDELGEVITAFNQMYRQSRAA